MKLIVKTHAGLLEEMDSFVGNLKRVELMNL